MKIFDLLRNPLIKSIGIILILYFALFANKEKPESLGNRLSPQQIKESVSDLKETSSFISEKIRLGKEQKVQLETAEKSAAKITINDIELGTEEAPIACNDEVMAAYGLYTSQGKQLEFFNSQKLTIGSKKNLLLEKNIIGMKRGGIREISIPRYFQTDDKKLADLLNFHATDLKYRVTLLSFEKPAISSFSCE